MRQKEFDHFFSVFRDAFGHFSVTFSDAPVTFFRHFFAKLLLPDSLLRQGDLGSAISRVRQDTFAEKVKVRQESINAAWGSARSVLFEFLAFRKIILLSLLWGVILSFLNFGVSLSLARSGP